jgi:UDP-N-acetylglucosamine:LPS N-acetylglucosamine transferase
MARHVEHRRVCWAFSPGGHLAELERATEGIAFADCFHLTYDCGRSRAASAPRCYFVCHPRRSVWRTLLNAWQTLGVLVRERPALILSTGADVAVPALILGKLLGAEIIFIETAGTVRPSLSGRLAYPIADLFIVPWPEKLRVFPRAVLARGPLL